TKPAETLANAAKVVEKVQEWTDEQKLQAASEILHVLKREGYLVLDADEWELVPGRAGGFLRGPFPFCNSDWAMRQASNYSSTAYQGMSRAGRKPRSSRRSRLAVSSADSASDASGWAMPNLMSDQLEDFASVSVSGIWIRNAGHRTGANQSAES